MNEAEGDRSLEGYTEQKGSSDTRGKKIKHTKTKVKLTELCQVAIKWRGTLIGYYTLSNKILHFVLFSSINEVLYWQAI